MSVMEELQILTRLNSTDITQLVFELIKDAPDEVLDTYIQKCTDEKLKGVILNDSKSDTAQNTSALNSRRFSLEKWLGGQ